MTEKLRQTYETKFKALSQKRKEGVLNATEEYQFRFLLEALSVLLESDEMMFLGGAIINNLASEDEGSDTQAIK
jgi:hypothetical protein